MTVDGNKLYFVYDAAGTPIQLAYTPAGSTTTSYYYYVTNLQGDVIAILNSSGAVVVEYTYDAWGNILSITGSMATTLGRQNPLRYRGYVYDQETGLYYLQSRYYDPEIGRFINADAFTSTGQGLLGNNMFAYCNNNPATYKDPSGTLCVFAFMGDYRTQDILTTGGGGGGNSASAVAIVSHEDYLKLKPEFTESTGIAVSSSWGGATGGQAACLSKDNCGNYAIQETTSLGSSTGLGTSVSIYKTFTNAKDVQDLSGESSNWGFTIGNGIAFSLDMVTFVPSSDPKTRKWGITIGVGFGVGVEFHGANSYTTSQSSWTIRELIHNIIRGG